LATLKRDDTDDGWVAADTDTDAGASAAMIAVPGCARARSEPREEHG